MIILNKFNEVEIQYFNVVKKLFAKRLCFYCVTGSTARVQNVNDWSDVDIIMVFDNLKVNDLIILNNEILKLKTTIKIGITCYSIEDIKLRLIDTKTANMIRNLNVCKYKPKVDSLNIRKVLNINDEFVLNLNRVEFSKDMHVFRREIMKDIGFDERKTYKTLTYLIRVLLFNSGYIVDGYFETWTKVLELGWTTKDNVIFPIDIINNNLNLKARLRIYNLWYEFIQEKERFILGK